VKTVLKGKKFQDVEDMKKNMMAELKTVFYEAFAECFHKLFKRFNECSQVGSDYFE
jgi:hypothetical protein